MWEQDSSTNHLKVNEQRSKDWLAKLYGGVSRSKSKHISLSSALCHLIMEHKVNGNLQPFHTATQVMCWISAGPWAKSWVARFYTAVATALFTKLSWPDREATLEVMLLPKSYVAFDVFHVILRVALFTQWNDTHCHADVVKLLLAPIFPRFSIMQDCNFFNGQCKGNIK